jgi:hypothetical protein
MIRLAVIVLAVLAVCVLAVILVQVLAPDLSWADVFEWLRTDPVCEEHCQ